MSNNSFLAQEVREGARTPLLTSPSSPRPLPPYREPGPPLETLQVLGQLEARAPSCAGGGLLPRAWGAGAVGSSTPGAQPRAGQQTATPQGGKRAALLILGPWAPGPVFGASALRASGLNPLSEISFAAPLPPCPWPPRRKQGHSLLTFTQETMSEGSPHPRLYPGNT